MLDGKRLQLDVRDFPAGIVPAFKMLAVKQNLTPTALARSIIIEYVQMETEPLPEPKVEKAPWS